MSHRIVSSRIAPSAVHGPAGLHARTLRPLVSLSICAVCSCRFQTFVVAAALGQACHCHLGTSNSIKIDGAVDAQMTGPNSTHSLQEGKTGDTQMLYSITTYECISATVDEFRKSMAMPFFECVMFGDTLHCLDSLLERTSKHAPSYLSECLRRLSEAYGHPGASDVFDRPRIRQQILDLIHSASADADMHDSYTVSCLCKVQLNLRLCSSGFWAALSAEQVGAWDAPTASSVAQAYNELAQSDRDSDVKESAEIVVLAAVEQHAVDMDASTTAKVAVSLARSSRLFSGTCRQLQERVSCLAGCMSSQEVTDTIWAFATANEMLGCAEEPLFQQIRVLSATMDSHNIADVLWALRVLKGSLATLQEPMMHAVQRVASCMLEGSSVPEEVSGIPEADVANILQSLTRMKVDIGPVEDLLFDTIERLSDRMIGEDVASILRALSDLQNGFSKRVLEHLMPTVARTAAEMDGRDLANTLRALCTLRVDLGKAQDPLLQAVPVVVKSMDANSVQKMLRSLVGINLGKGGWDKVQQCQLEALVRVAPDLTATGVANALFSLRMKCKDLGVAQKPLIEALGRVADQFGAEDVSKALISCAHFKLDLRDEAGALMQSVARAAEQSMNTIEVVKTLFAVGTLRLPPGPAQVPLIQAFMRVSPDLMRTHLSQVRKGLEWLQLNDPATEDTEAAMRSLAKAEHRLLKQKRSPLPVL